MARAQKRGLELGRVLLLVRFYVFWWLTRGQPCRGSPRAEKEGGHGSEKGQMPRQAAAGRGVERLGRHMGLGEMAPS